MLIHVGYHKTGSTCRQQHAFTEARGFTTAMGVPRHRIVADIVWPPVVERRPTRALERRRDAGWRRQIAAHVGDSYAESNRRTVALTGLPLADLGCPLAGSI